MITTVPCYSVLLTLFFFLLQRSKCLITVQQNMIHERDHSKYYKVDNYSPQHRKLLCCNMKFNELGTKSHCIYNFPIDLNPSRSPFESKPIGKR